MPIPSVFGQRLSELRKKREWSQADLAKASGVPVVMVSHFETGVRLSASAATLWKLAAALSVSIDYLIGRTDDSIPLGGEVMAVLRDLSENASADTIQKVVTIGKALAKEDAERSASRASERDQKPDIGDSAGQT